MITIPTSITGIIVATIKNSRIVRRHKPGGDDG